MSLEDQLSTAAALESALLFLGRQKTTEVEYAFVMSWHKRYIEIFFFKPRRLIKFVVHEIDKPQPALNPISTGGGGCFPPPAQ